MKAIDLNHPDPLRRKLVLAGALVLAFPALAQDPRVSEAQAVGMAWLALADADNAAGTYAAAAKRFRDTVPADQWPAAFAQARGQFGKNLRRTIVSIQPNSGSAEVKGEFVVMVFRAEFERREQAVETVTLEREADGKWRVAGYLMR